SSSLPPTRRLPHNRRKDQRRLLLAIAPRLLVRPSILDLLRARFAPVHSGLPPRADLLHTHAPLPRTCRRPLAQLYTRREQSCLGHRTHVLPLKASSLWQLFCRRCGLTAT